SSSRQMTAGALGMRTDQSHQCHRCPDRGTRLGLLPEGLHFDLAVSRAIRQVTYAANDPQSTGPHTASTATKSVSKPPFQFPGGTKSDTIAITATMTGIAGAFTTQNGRNPAPDFELSVGRIATLIAAKHAVVIQN